VYRLQIRLDLAPALTPFVKNALSLQQVATELEARVGAFEPRGAIETGFICVYAWEVLEMNVIYAGCLFLLLSEFL
jgi:hypothetical protein